MLIEYFWTILLVAVAISCCITKDWWERIFMVVYYALGLLFAVHVDAWGWKLAFIIVVGSICCFDNKGIYNPCHTVGYNIISAMVLYTITVKWFPLPLLQGVAGVITTAMCFGTVIITIISNKKSVKA